MPGLNLSEPASRPPVITIDGPGGCGKSSLAQFLAGEFGLFHLNTGNFYRALTFRVLETDRVFPAESSENPEAGGGSEESEEMTPEQKKLIISLARETDWEVLRETPRGPSIMKLNGEIVREDSLHTGRVDRRVASVSALPEVREIINGKLRLYRNISSGLAAEGRDTTTVVFPDADFRFYLDASPEIRSRRRHRESREGLSYRQISSLLDRRDQSDIRKKTGNLFLAEGVHYLDTTNLTLDAVYGKVLRIIKQKI